VKEGGSEHDDETPWGSY